MLVFGMYYYITDAEEVTNRFAKLNAICALNVDFPTPPLPDNTSILCLISPTHAFTSLFICCDFARASPEAQIDWFGHPSQELTLPASSEFVPTQLLFAFVGTSVREVFPLVVFVVIDAMVQNGWVYLFVSLIYI